MGDQDVFRLDIAMGHAGGMRGVQCGCDLAHDGHRPCGLIGPVRRNMVDKSVPSISRMSKYSCPSISP